MKQWHMLFAVSSSQIRKFMMPPERHADVHVKQIPSNTHSTAGTEPHSGVHSGSKLCRPRCIQLDNQKDVQATTSIPGMQAANQPCMWTSTK
eukprot:365810-Chlamydomonas_euryale.AAC.24